MIKYTIIGDPHAKPDNLDKIETLFQIVEDLGNPTIWLGDMLDTKELIRGKCLNAYLRYFQQSKLDHIVLVGNHDLHRLEGSEHSLEPFKLLKNVKIIDEPVTLILGKTPCRFYPYLHDSERIRRDLLLFYTIPIFGHFDIQEFDYGNGHISDKGLLFSDCERFPSVISGHYHAYQKRGTVTYLGTPFSHSFGESNQLKYIGIWDAETFQMELIETPFPKHVTLSVTLSDTPIPLALDNDLDLMRIVLKGTQEQIDKHPRHENVRYIEEPTSLQKASAIRETDSPEVQFVQWAKDIKGYSDELISLGLEVLNDV